MGASSSSQSAPAVRAEAIVAAPPQGCPMHQDAQPVKGIAVMTLPFCNSVSNYTTW